MLEYLILHSVVKFLASIPRLDTLLIVKPSEEEYLYYGFILDSLISF
jgi:hypothetical protein